MSAEAYVEQLRICPLRPKGPLPRVSSRLLETVRDHGVVEPVVVRRVGERYEILGNVEGWMAAQQAGLEAVPIHVLEHISDADAEEIMAAAFDGYSSNPIDEAEYFQSQVPLNDQGRCDHKAVTRLAYRTGYGRPYISHSLRLLRLPPGIQDLIRDGTLSAGHGRALAGIKRRSSQAALAKRVMTEKLTVRQTESAAREIREGRSAQLTTEAARKPHRDPDTLRLQNRISEALGCSTSIDASAARLTIDYHNLDILDGVLARLGISAA